VFVSSAGLAKILQLKTKTIPIVVGRAAVDLVAAGLVDRLARPGSNITGSQLLSDDLVPKRLELLKTLIPTLSRVAFLREDVTTSALPQIRARYDQQATVAARSCGIGFWGGPCLAPYVTGPGATKGGNRCSRVRMLPIRYFRQEFLVRVATMPPLSDSALAKLRAECRRLSRTDGIDKAMREHRLDAIIAPTDGVPAFPIDLVDGDRIDSRTFGGCSSPAAMAGYPHLTVPAGDVLGLPGGLSLYAGSYSEAKLIDYAYAFEQATHARLTPQFTATVLA